MKFFSLNGLSIRYKMYLRFVGAVLPLFIVVLYQQGERGDLSREVSHALKQYNLALEIADHYRGFVSAVSDAIADGSNKLTDQGKADLALAVDKCRTLVQKEGGVDLTQVSRSLDAIQIAVGTNDLLSMMMKMNTELNDVKTRIDDTAKTYRATLGELSDKISEQQRRDRIKDYIITAVTVATMLTLSLQIKRSVDKVATPISVAVSAARRVAQGDLTGHINALQEDDEIAALQRALRDMNRSLTNIVSEVRKVSQDVSSRTQTIAHSNKNMAGQMRSQAVQLAGTTERIKTMLNDVVGSANNAKQANSLARDAAKVADKGGEMMAEVTNTMTSIKGSSEKVVKIIGIIEDIAFQTNLLALNAAVEAARAGEQGRGFAVVASEVGNLAQRSASTAKEIRDIIGNSVARVEAGADLVNTTADTMRELVASVSRVAAVIEEIESTALRHTGEAQRASQAIAEVENMMKKNSQLVDETAAQTNSMLMRTAQLTAAVSKFKLYRHRRLDVPGRAVISEKTRWIGEAAVKNLSATGVYVEFNGQLESGGMYTLKMNLGAEFAKDVLVECELVRVNSLPGGVFGYGMRFSRIRSSDRDALRAEVTKLFASQGMSVDQRDVEDSIDVIQTMDPL